MSKAFPADPFLSGNYAPLQIEGEAFDLPIEGELPRELHGTLYRNGPNPQFAPRGRYHWFDGDGMIHAFRLRDGRASYRNRWVRTQRFALERAAGEGLFGSIADLASGDPRVAGLSGNAANTNIVWHAGRLLALWEAGPPHSLDPVTLETLGPHDFGGKLVGPMTAHPKLDPETGEMGFFGYAFTPPFLRYHVADAQGRLVRSIDIDVPWASMMHDFVMTPRHVIFMLFPATIRLENVERTGSPIGWEPELGARIGVMPREGASADVRWFEIDPCYAFHPMNAWDDGDHVVTEVCRYPRLPLFADAGTQALEDLDSKLTRWTLDLAGGSVKEERLDDVAVEFPRLDERRSGLRYRHGYGAGMLPSGEDRRRVNAIFHWDLATGRRREHVVPCPDVVGEPIFVPRHAGAEEGDGWLLVVVFRGEEQRSDLLVLDARNVERAPVATVRLSHRVPFGFHGNWAPGV
jgi:carotenoid cleavage dioxygenase-like enzyme